LTVPRVRAVLLDAAGTLIRLREPVGETYARAALVQGVALPPARIEDAFQRILRSAPPMVFPGNAPARVRALERAWWRDVVRATFRAADQTARLPDLPGCFEALFEHYGSAAAWETAPGAAEALRGLQRPGRRVAVLSNFDHPLPPLLTALGLREDLDDVMLAGELGVAKPDPRAFALALARLGVLASGAVSVGDHPERDVEAARRAGLRAIDAHSLATLAELPTRIDALEEEARDA
jgi:putative hydrolase of the HAD superfamily